MKPLFQLELSAWRQYAAVVVLFLLLSSVVIGKALLLDNCMAFDASDDLNHTFTGLYMAKKLLSNGAMPYFNFYNNFGTPLMGDAVTYPFAIQAIPYYFTGIDNYPLVLTVNRFVLCFATLTSLLVFYRTFNISIFSSAIAAICVFFNFGFYWHFAHHHYQATVLFAVCILIFQRVSLRKNNYKMLFISVAILSALMIYSVSANLILLCFVFFVIHPFLYYRSPRAIVVNALALFSGGLLGIAQMITTVLAMMNSVRSSKSYVDAFYIKFSWLELMLRMLFQDRPSGVHIGHVYLVAYLPMFIVLAYTVGLYILFKEKRNRTLALSLVLGLFPLLLTCLLLVNSGFWRSIPLLRSTDITRILWIAMIFIGIGIGIFSDAIQKKVINKQISWFMVIVLTLVSCICTLFVLTEKSPAIFLLGYWSAWILMVLYLYRCYVNPHNSKVICNILPSKWSLVAGALILVSVVLTYCPIVHYLGNWGNPTSCRSVNYFTETPAIDPGRGQQMGRLSATGRFALKIVSSSGVELVAGTFGRHGGGARSIAMDGKLQDILLSKGLIETDEFLSAYHFSAPWDNTVANMIGLRYFGTTDNGIHDNWKLIDQWGDFFIYENEHKPSIIYLSDGSNKTIFIESFRIEGNNIYIDLPRTMNGGLLHVTITARPGFSVYVDGVRHGVGVDEFGFISVGITSTNKIVRVSYNPLDFYWL